MKKAKQLFLTISVTTMLAALFYFLGGPVHGPQPSPGQGVVRPQGNPPSTPANQADHPVTPGGSSASISGQSNPATSPPLAESDGSTGSSGSIAAPVLRPFYQPSEAPLAVRPDFNPGAPVQLGEDQDAQSGQESLFAAGTKGSGKGSGKQPKAPVGNSAMSCKEVAWVDLLNVVAQGNTIDRLDVPANPAQAGANSLQQILSGDGWVQFTIDSVNSRKIFGLSSLEAEPGVANIEFGIYLAGNELAVYESGVPKAKVGTANVGDVIRVADEKGRVNYYLNGTHLYTSSKSPSHPLAAEGAIDSTQARITGATICGQSLGSRKTRRRTPTAVPNATITPTVVSPSTQTVVPASTRTSTAISTAVPTATSTSTQRPALTTTSTSTYTAVAVNTQTSTPLPTNTPTTRPSFTSTPVATFTRTATAVPTATATLARTATPTATASFTATATSTNTPGSGQTIYWGAYMNGSTYGYGDAPWDARTISTFEGHAGKPVSIIHWGEAWQASDGSMQPFETTQYDNVRQHGAIPMINWNPWESCCGTNQPNWSLATIINGSHDAYIQQWATAARDWGHPFFLRIMDEMNGTWYPWSEAVNGNQPGQYVQAWRHIHDIFTQVGATNVAWVWCPNTEYSGSLPLEALYPGNNYVDWTAVDGYNWGTNPSKPDLWLSFSQVFTPIYNHLLSIAPGKPIMIAETSSTEYGGSKANWITDALTVQLPHNFPAVRALVWFNWDADGMDWLVETSSAAQAAFASGIASPYYAENNYSTLNHLP